MIQDPAKYSETDESKADPMRSMAGIIDKLKLDSQRDIINGFLRTGGALNPGVGGNYPFDNATTDPLYASEQPKSGWGETFDAMRHRESFAYGLLHRGDRILQRLTGDFKTDPNFNSLDWMAKNYGQIQDIPEHIWARFGAGEYNDARSEEELFWLLSLDMQYDEWKRIIGNASLPTQLTTGLGAAVLDPTTYIIPMAGAVNRSIRAGRAAQYALEMGATAKLAAEIGKDAGKAGMLARLSTTPVLSGFATASTNETMLQLLDRDQRDADESVVNLLMNTAFDTAVHAGVRLYGKGKNAFVDWLNEDGGRLETPINKEAIRAVTESNGGVVDVPETTADANVATEALRREGVAQTAVEGEVIDAPDVAARQTFDPQQVAKSVEPEQTPQAKPTADTESQSSQTVREQPANELAPTREIVATQESSPIVGTREGKQPWEMMREEYVGEYREPYSVKDIQEASKKAKGQRQRFNARTGAIVPPAISREIADKISKNESTAEGMREAYRTYIAAYQRGVEDHYRHVERALREGLPVPPSVLADYPDLKPAETAQKQFKQLTSDEILAEAELSRFRRAKAQFITEKKLEYRNKDSSAILTKSSKPGVVAQITRFSKNGKPFGDTQFHTLQSAISEFLKDYPSFDTRKDLPGDFGLVGYDAPRLYLYEGTQRPISPGAIPADGIVETRVGGKYGIVAYSRALSESEISHYDLRPIGFEEIKPAAPAESGGKASSLGNLESAAKERINARNVARAQARKGGKRLGSAPIFEDAIDHAIIAAHIVARSGKRAISDIVAAVQEAIKNRPDLQEHIDRMVEAVKRIIDTAYEKGTFSAQDYIRASDSERRAAKIGSDEVSPKVNPKDYEPVQPKDVTGKDVPNYTSFARGVSSGLNKKGIPTPTPATRLMYSPATSVRAAANILFPSMRLEGQESGRVFRGQKAAAVVADAQRFKIKIAAQVEEAKNAIIGKNLGSLQAYFRRGQLRWFNQNRFNLGLTNLTDQTIAEAGLAVAIRRNATPNRPIGQIHAEVRQLMMTRVTDRLAKDGELHKVGISDKNFRPDTIVDEAMKSASQIVSSNFNLPTMALALTTKIDASDPKMTRLIGLLEALGRKDDVAKLQEMVGKVEKGEENATTLDNLRNQIINEVNRKRLSMRELTTGIREQMLEVDEYGNLKYPEAASISDESIMHAVYSLMEPDLAGEPDPKAMALLADMGIDGMDFARHARASITKSVNISQDARIVRKWLDSVSHLYTEMGWDKARLIDDEGNFKTPEELLSVLQEDMVAHLGDDGLKRETPEYSRAVGDIVDVITSSKIILGLTRIDSSSLDVALAGLQQLSSAFYLAGSVGSVSQEVGATMALVGPQKYAESLFNVRIAPVARELAKLDAADPELGAFARETLTKFGLGLEERHVALKRMVERTDLPMEEAPSGIPARLGAAYVASTRRIYEIAGEGDVPLINLIPVLNKAIKATSLGGAAQHNLKAAVSSWSQLVWGWMPELAKIERFRAEGLSVKEAIAKAGSKMPAWMADDLINYLDKSDLGYMAGLHDKAEAIRAKYAPDDPMRAKELHDLGVVEIAGTILPGEIPGRPAHNKVVNDFASATLQMVKLAAPQPGIGEKPLAAQTSRYFSLVWQFLTIPNAMISTGAVSKAGMMDLHQQAGLFATLLGAGALDMASRYWIRDGFQQGTANLEKDWNNDPAMIVSNVIGRAGIVGLWDKLTSPALAFLAGSSYEVKDRVSRALTPPVVTYLSTLTAGIQSLLHIGSEKGLTPAQERDLRRLTVVRNMVWSQAISSIIAGEYTTAKGGSVPVRSRPTYRVSGNKLISPQRQRQLALEAYDTDNLSRAGSAPAKR